MERGPVGDADVSREGQLEPVLEAAMPAPYLTHVDEFDRFDRVPVRPRQQPTPPIWMTSLSAASAERTARRGHKLALAWLSAEYLRKLADAYRAAGTGPAAGDPDRIGLRRRVFLQIGNLLLWTDFRAFTPGHLDRCHELIGRHLAPALRKAAL